MEVPFLDLKKQYLSIKDEIDQAVAGVIDSCNFIMGQQVKDLEEKIARFCGVKFGVAVASGTDAPCWSTTVPEMEPRLTWP